MATPAKPATPMTPSPGRWQHPRWAEIRQRQQQSTFDSSNVRQIAFNAPLCLLSLCWPIFGGSIPFTANSALVNTLLPLTVAILSLYNISVALAPLYQGPDQMLDIPLSASQRRLLGLDPGATPPTAGTKADDFAHPPRYSPSPASSRRSQSPASSFGSPLSFASPLSQMSSDSPVARYSGSGGKRVASSPADLLRHRSSLSSDQRTSGSKSIIAASSQPLGGSVFGYPPSIPIPVQENLTSSPLERKRGWVLGRTSSFGSAISNADATQGSSPPGAFATPAPESAFSNRTGGRLHYATPPRLGDLGASYGPGTPSPLAAVGSGGANSGSRIGAAGMSVRLGSKWLYQKERRSSASGVGWWD